MERVVVLVVAIVSLRCATMNVDTGAPQRFASGPAATLLLPYFETSGDLRYDTSLTITNTDDTERTVRVTFWTDHGFATFWFPESIGPHATETLSTADILRGAHVVGAKKGHPVCDYPWPSAADCAGGRMAATLIGDANCVLRGAATSFCATPVGERHAHAIGYVTIDVVSGEGLLPPTDRAYYATLLDANVLTGTYKQRVDHTILAAGPLVHIAARNGLSSTFYQTFSHGDDHREPLPAQATITLPHGEAELHIWTAPTNVSFLCKDFGRPVMTSRRIRPWRRQTTIRGHQIWVTVSEPTPPDPNATPPPERCQSIGF